jgi:hypothetical protein
MMRIPNRKKTTYYKEDDQWWKMTIPARCDRDVFMGGKCPRVKGHDGDCWAYSPMGDYCFSVNGRLKPYDTAGGNIPCGHKDWIPPKDKQKEIYTSFITKEKVTNKSLITRLEREYAETR